ncbi:MAG: peptidoglycan editing factor PgeF [Thermomicrobiales bacterium]
MRHAVTTRHDALPLGGDMSFTTGDSCPDGIVANRRRWLATIGRSTDGAVACGLVHGTNIRVVTEADAGRGLTTPTTALPQSDGMITSEPGLSLMMCFADCVPLVVVDTERHVIGLAHAGWRGTLAGIAAHLIAAMQREYACSLDTLVAVIGPSIGPRIYVVGPEVARAFTQTHPDDRLLSDDGSVCRLDLWEANASQLRRAGLASDHIHVSGICTYEQGDRFFSHRYAQRHNEREGRFAVLVSIEE